MDDGIEKYGGGLGAALKVLLHVIFLRFGNDYD